MNFTPNDLQNIRFKKTVYGYSEDMVNEVLDKVIDDYSAYIRENMELKEKLDLLNESLQHYRSIEELLQNSLVVAQKTGEEVKKNAYDKAANIIAEAEMKAQKIINAANEEAAKIKLQHQELKGSIKVFRSKCESLIHSQLEIMRQLTE